VSDAREVILGRIAHALRDVPSGETPGDVAVARAYDHVGGGDHDVTPQTVPRFEQRVADYHAEVQRVAPDQVGPTITAACAQRGLAKLAVPPGLPAAWRPENADVTEDHNLTAHELDEFDGVVTGCAAAIAETGTIVLDGGERSGRRLLTLVPDHHICVVDAAQIADQVPAALAAVAAAVTEHRRPITLVSGPSASSDIELDRVEGVHGPRNLLVVIADPAAP
jgi:L-lactate dehydrogenase complex protein LldG